MKNAILDRISTRTFKDDFLSKDEITEIEKIITSYQDVKGPFGHSFEFTFNTNDKNETNGKKIGTYGFLKNVPAFIGGVCENNQESIIDFGYVFELIILELTKHNYDTCWLGGTFKRKNYRKELKENEIIPALSPVGHRASKRSFIDRTLRSAAQSNHRLSFDELFRTYGANQSLKIDMTNPVIEALSLVRKGPSASNKQPWRVFIENDYKMCHFYIKRTPNYAKPLKYDIQSLDIGIGLSHFEMGLKSHDLTFKRVKLDKPIEILDHEYIISIKISK